MIAAWMLYASAVSLSLCFAAIALERGLRLAGRPGRWVLAYAMVASVFLPLLPRTAYTGTDAGLAGNAMLSPTAYLVPLTDILPRGAALKELDLPLVVIWISLSAVLLAVVTLTHVQLARKLRHYPKERFDEAVVLRSPVLGPAVVGWLKSSIVLPAWVDEVGREWRDLMVLHEQEHLRSRDALLLSAAVLVVVMLPWNLPLWCLLFQLRRAIELDCDQRVISSGADVRHYGHLLLEVSRRRTRSPLPVIGLAFNRSFLAQRVDAMTLQMSRFRYPRAILAVVVGAAFVAIACELPAPPEPELDILALPQEVNEDMQENAVSLAASIEDDSIVSFAIRPQPIDLQRFRNALDIYAVANESTLVRISEELVERIRSGKLLMSVTEQDGAPVLMLLILRERVAGDLYPGAVRVPDGTKKSHGSDPFP